MNLGRGILGELDGMATLTFCGGDPVNMMDPTGLAGERARVALETEPRLSLPSGVRVSYRELGAFSRMLEAEREAAELFRELENLPYYRVVRIRKGMEQMPLPSNRPNILSAAGPTGEDARIQAYESYASRTRESSATLRYNILRQTNPREADKIDAQADALNAVLRKLAPSIQPETVSPKSLAPATPPVVNSSMSSAGAAPKTSPAYTQMEFPFARGASVQTPGVTTAGERFVRVGAEPRNLKLSFDSLGGVQDGTYVFPESTFEAIGRDPKAFKNFGDLPGRAPQYYRIIEPPAGTPIQRGIVPGGEYGGVGGVQEAILGGF